jgi:hypothetical protein
MTLNKIHLIYNPKDKGMLHSARWRKYYCPDLSMITHDPAGDDITTTRHISNRFLRSQHHPVFQHYDLRTPLTRSVPKHCRNFAIANWDRFTRDLNHVIQFISAESGLSDRFTKAVVAAAKRHILRCYENQYIPEWYHQCDGALRKFQFRS